MLKHFRSTSVGPKSSQMLAPMLGRRHCPPHAPSPPSPLLFGGHKFAPFDVAMGFLASWNDPFHRPPGFTRSHADAAHKMHRLRFPPKTSGRACALSSAPIDGTNPAPLLPAPSKSGRNSDPRAAGRQRSARCAASQSRMAEYKAYRFKIVWKTTEPSLEGELKAWQYAHGPTTWELRRFVTLLGYEGRALEMSQFLNQTKKSQKAQPALADLDALVFRSNKSEQSLQRVAAGRDGERECPRADLLRMEFQATTLGILHIMMVLLWSRRGLGLQRTRGLWRAWLCSVLPVDPGALRPSAWPPMSQAHGQDCPSFDPTANGCAHLARAADAVGAAAAGDRDLVACHFMSLHAEARDCVACRGYLQSLLPRLAETINDNLPSSQAICDPLEMPDHLNGPKRRRRYDEDYKAAVATRVVAEGLGTNLRDFAAAQVGAQALPSKTAARWEPLGTFWHQAPIAHSPGAARRSHPPMKPYPACPTGPPSPAGSLKIPPALMAQHTRLHRRLLGKRRRRSSPSPSRWTPVASACPRRTRSCSRGTRLSLATAAGSRLRRATPRAHRGAGGRRGRNQPRRRSLGESCTAQEANRLGLRCRGAEGDGGDAGDCVTAWV